MQLINSILKNHDYIFRFLYSKCPIVRNILHFVNKKGYNIDNIYSLRVFKKTSNIFKKNKIDFKGKVMLELGPGNNYGVGYSFLSSGVKKYIFCDKFPRKNNKEDKTRIFFENLFLQKINDDQLQYIQNGAECLKNIITNSIDIIISISVLEHVQNVKKAFQEMYRVLKPGGIAYASIDLRDHFNFNHPLLFLKYSNYIYDNFLSCPGYSYTNRLREDDYRKILESMPFEIIIYNKSYIETNINYELINKNFLKKGEDVLKIIQLQMLLKKV